MSLANTFPMMFSPVGLSDTLDASSSFRGAMASLKNLIPDPSTRNLWQCRPASIPQTTFPAFNTPGFVSALEVIGTRAYGMIASAANPGKDEPFCFDLETGAFVTITGVTNDNTPASPASTGAWTPPTMSLVGSKMVVTHPGFSVTAKFFGWLDLSDPAVPTWDAGNTAINALPAVPTAVQNFNGRAYYLVNPASAQPGAYFSDALDPLNITNANQILTFDDNVPLTALGALPLSNQLGGIIQSLIVFKGATNMYQITGDSALMNLTVNSLNVATGTLAPNSICSTPKGLAFMAPDGIRYIDFNAQVSDPVGDSGEGITVPFIFANVPSRVCAACNAKVLRVTTQNNNATGSPFQEYWYDLTRGVWSGPHSFPASLIQPYGKFFILSAQGVNAKLFKSESVQSNISTFVENGTQLDFNYLTSVLPDTKQMAENAMLETTLKMAFAAGGQYAVTAQDEQGSIFDTYILAAAGNTTLWGNFVWGQALWQGAANALAVRLIPWQIPIVFSRIAMGVTGNSAAGVKIGDIGMRYEQLGYVLQI